MNFSNKSLKEINEFYSMLAWTIIKNNEWGKKLSPHIRSILSQYNLIIDLIEDLEECRKEVKRK